MNFLPFDNEIGFSNSPSEKFPEFPGFPGELHANCN
jgi:hypothetical protein